MLENDYESHIYNGGNPFAIIFIGTNNHHFWHLEYRYRTEKCHLLLTDLEDYPRITCLQLTQAECSFMILRQAVPLLLYTLNSVLRVDCLGAVQTTMLKLVILY